VASSEIKDLRARLQTARTKLTQAHWDASLELLNECEDWPVEIAETAVLVKADALLRRDGAAALAWLATTSDVVATDATRFHRELITGRAFANVRNFAAAAARFERARMLLDRVPDGAPKLAYQTARLRWFKREARPNDADVLLALEDADPSGRAAAYAVRAWTHTMTGDYRSQIVDLKKALDVAAQAGYACDVATLGIIVHTLARVAFEIADEASFAVAKTAFERIEWTDDVRVDKFQTLRALGLNAFMRGDAARAQWFFRDAIATAPSPAFRALAHLDRAYVARVMRNETWALDEVAEAIRISQGIAWGETFGEERITLVMLAVQLAPVDASAAQRFAATYSMLGVENVSPMLALAHEKRAIATESFALARIEQTLGNTDFALGMLRDAYDVFSPIEHHYQAMQVASAIAELSDDPQWAAKARGHIEKYPGCPMLAQTIDRGAPSDPIFDSLTPVQRQLARAHWSGGDVATLSRRFSRSLYTVERHISEIYRAFGVNSESGLREEALRRNLV